MTTKIVRIIIIIGMLLGWTAPAVSARSATTISSTTIHRVGGYRHTTTASRNGSILVAGERGYWHSGCQLTALNYWGSVIYTVTVWQDFSSNYTYILSYSPPSADSTAYYGWTGSTSNTVHWWTSYRKVLSARTDFNFQQHVAGQPYQSRSGSVQVNVKYDGTWSC